LNFLGRVEAPNKACKSTLANCQHSMVFLETNKGKVDIINESSLTRLLAIPPTRPPNSKAMNLQNKTRAF